MKKIIFFCFLTLSLSAFAQNLATGQSFINDLLVNKDYVKAYSVFDENIKSKISEDVLIQTVSQLEKQLGRFKTILETHQEKETYFYYSDFENIKLDIKISFNDNGQIAGFYFVPHKEINKDKALGTELNINSSGITLNGTVLIPTNDNLKKLVIFVHGSGPNDRDETLLENKPFRDLAENFYSKGIASYRFDKKTLTNPESFTDLSTIDDEVTTDVLNIINYFKADAQFLNYEIIVISHSLGAYLLPRIANKSDKISKIIMLAANARPLDKLIVEQYDYLYQLNPTVALKNELNAVKIQVALLRSKLFTLTTPKEKLPLNLSATYWQSLILYHPLKEIQNVKTPILILQGERDYQVRMTDFELWKNSLKKNTKAVFISYPSLNHLFMTGKPTDSKHAKQGLSDPKEYAIKGTVNEKVMADILTFIQQK